MVTRDASGVFPKPLRVESQPGTVKLCDLRVVPGDFPLAEAEARRRVPSSGHLPFTLQRLKPGSGAQTLGTEGYFLTVSPEGVRIEANADAGAFYALQTLAQLLPPGESDLAVATLPCLVIMDRPLYEWRGFMLDVSRHMFSVAEIKRLLDWLAFHKFNVFHWHLTDDGGWRLESKAFPNLTQHGAWREHREAGWDYFDIKFPGRESDLKLYGGFFTQQEVKEVIAYAAERFITVVPEIDIPGHALAACASYPELTCSPEAIEAFVAMNRMAGSNVLCVGKASTYDFLEQLIDEVVGLFPSKVIHVGGDEVDHVLWKNCTHCQALKAAHGLTTEAQLHGHFVAELSRMLTSRGRTLMGWDEILDDGLVEGAMVMSWRGSEGGILAAGRGHDVVMTPTKHCYFDYSYDVLPSEVALVFDPTKNVPPEHRKHIRGGQANLWTEYVPTWAEIERRTFPRLAALAEALWNGPGESASWIRRLPGYLARLEEMGVHYEGSPRAHAPASFQEGVVYLNN